MKSHLIPLLALFGTLCFTSPRAHAAPAESIAIQAGHLEARGRGEVRLEARGGVTFQLFGDGTLVIPDSDDLRVVLHGAGAVRVTDDGTLIAHRFRGEIHVAGDDIRARFGDGHVVLRTRGHGRALLDGMGGFAANGVTGHWSASGTPVHW